MAINKIAVVLLVVGLVVGAGGGFGASSQIIYRTQTVSDTLREEIEFWKGNCQDYEEKLWEEKQEKFRLWDELYEAEKELNKLKMEQHFEELMEEYKEEQGIPDEIEGSPFENITRFPAEDIESFPAEEIGKFETEIEEFDVLVKKFETGEIAEFPVEKIAELKVGIQKFNTYVAEFKGMLK